MRLTARQRAELLALEVSPNASAAVRKRCRVLRFWAQAKTVREVASELSVSTRTVVKWVKRYRAGGIQAISTSRPRGATGGKLLNAAAEELATLGRDVSVTTREAARRVGLSAATVQRFWAKRRIR